MNFRFLLATVALAISSSGQAGEIVNLKALKVGTSQTLSLLADENARLINMAVIPDAHYFSVRFDDESEWSNFDLGNYNLENFTVVGPALIKLHNGGSGPALMSFEVNRKADVTVTVPVASVVIPEDASGQFQVILESSTDTITWTQAQPGTYGSSTVKRFFRTRIVKVQ